MLGRKISHGTLTVFLAESLALPAGLIIAMLLSRALGPAGYGRYGVAASIVVGVEWLVVACYTRISIQLLTDEQRYERLVPPILRLYFLTAFFAMALLCALSGTISNLLKAPHLVSDLRWIALDIPLFALAQAQRNLLTARRAYSGRAAGIAARWVSRVVVTWGLLVFGWGIYAALWGWPIASVAELLYMRRLPVWALLRRGDRMSEVWREGWAPFLFSLGQRSLERMDLLLVQALGVAPAGVGVYVAAQNLAILPGLLGASLSPVLISALTHERLSGREPASRETSARSLRSILYLLPLAPVSGMCGSDVAAFVFGEPYRDAGHLLGWLVAGAIGLVLAGASVSIVSAQGRHRVTAWFSLPAAALAATLHLMVIPRYGMTGAAIVTAGVGLASGLTAVFVVFRSWRQSFPAGTLLRVAGASFLLLLGSVWSPVALLSWPVRLCVLVLAAAAFLLLLGEWKLRQLRALLAPGFKS